MVESSNEIFVRGIDVDAETRCTHWHSSLDIIAIKFECCGEWYACHDCHREVAGHDASRWSSSDFDQRAILCGACKSQITIREYLASDSKCPRCGADFNPGCAKHYDLYFQM